MLNVVESIYRLCAKIYLVIRFYKYENKNDNE